MWVFIKKLTYKLFVVNLVKMCLVKIVLGKISCLNFSKYIYSFEVYLVSRFIPLRLLSDITFLIRNSVVTDFHDLYVLSETFSCYVLFNLLEVCKFVGNLYLEFFKYDKETFCVGMWLPFFPISYETKGLY